MQDASGKGEGHPMYRYSDERLKQAIERAESALAALRELEAGADVEGHVLQRYVSDERLKQAIEQTETALSTLRELLAASAGGDGGRAGVEGHAYRH
jgi:hypothetical protein